MAIDRPRILTRFTVPTGGWTMQINAENGINDVTISATVPAGDYFVSWDQQSDDFLWKLCGVVNDAYHAASGSLTGWVGTAQGMCASIDSDHKVVLGFTGSYFGSSPGREIKLEWTQQDGDEIAKILGFDESADDTLTGVNNPTTTSDNHHAYGWYADTDGQLEFLGIEPQDIPESQQSFSPSGHSKVQYLGSKYENELRLSFIPSDKTWSGDTAYKVAPSYPYSINEPLECWFKEARKGTEFRVYRQNIIDTTKANEGGVATSGSSVSIIDSGKSWTTNEFVGMLLFLPTTATANAIMAMRYYIESNTATQITVNQQEPPIGTLRAAGGDNTYYVFSQKYETYVIDVNQMGGFRPTELPNIDKFSLSVPLVRYES